MDKFRRVPDSLSRSLRLFEKRDGRGEGNANYDAVAEISESCRALLIISLDPTPDQKCLLGGPGRTL